MKIGIIGAGLTGLSATYALSKLGHKVVLFEKGSALGGLATGYREKDWKWSTEEHYHHFFTNDATIVNLAKEINHKIIIKRPKTSTLINGRISQLDSPLSLLKFPLLTFSERLRMGIALAFLRYNPFWKPLDRYKAWEILPKLMGKKGFQMIWAPLFLAKFSDYAKDVSLAWFWARIRKRTTSLAYPEGGFLSFAQNLKMASQKHGAQINLNSEVVEINNILTQLKIRTGNKIRQEKFDKIIITIPTLEFLKIAKSLPNEYKDGLADIKSLGATNLLLRLKEPFLTDGTYWLNVCDTKSPLMAVVEHTNFMDKKYYNDEHIIYIGHYVPRTHRYFLMNKEDLLKEFDPYLKKLNKEYKTNLIDYKLFKTPFAQPVMPANYGGRIPPFKTPFKNVFLANIDRVYPWDRGTNYAVELGEKVADYILDEN